MEEIISNQQKYENYREQMGKLNRAIKSKFFFEAIFIEYAVIEDRLESIIRYAGQWNYKSGKKVLIEDKLKKVTGIISDENNPAYHYFTVEQIKSIREWKNHRNELIHALLKNDFSADDIEETALKGKELARKLCNCTTSYKRKLQRQAEKSAN